MSKPVGRTVNHQKGIFAFVHVAETRKQAIESGAALSTLWYAHIAPIAFKVPRALMWDIIRQGLSPQLARNVLDRSAPQAATRPSLRTLPTNFR